MRILERLQKRVSEGLRSPNVSDNEVLLVDLGFRV